MYMRGGYCARMTIHPGTSVLANALEMCPLYFRQSSITEKHDTICNCEYGFGGRGASVHKRHPHSL